MIRNRAFHRRVASLRSAALMLVTLSALPACGGASPAEEQVGSQKSAIETCTNGVCPEETCGACEPDRASPLGGYQQCKRGISYTKACTPPSPMTCTQTASGGVCIQKCCKVSAEGVTGCGFTPCPAAKSAQGSMLDSKLSFSP